VIERDFSSAGSFLASSKPSNELRGRQNRQMTRAQIRVGDQVMIMMDPNLIQILLDGVAPKSLAEALIQTSQQMREDDPSLLPDPI